MFKSASTVAAAFLLTATPALAANSSQASTSQANSASLYPVVSSLSGSVYPVLLDRKESDDNSDGQWNQNWRNPNGQWNQSGNNGQQNVSGSVYGPSSSGGSEEGQNHSDSDHHGWDHLLKGILNALTHVKHEFARDVLQAILNGTSPATVVKQVYQHDSVTKNVYGSVDGDDQGDHENGDSLKSVLSALETDQQDSKEQIADAALQLADSFLQRGDVANGIKSVEDSVYDNPSNGNAFGKLGKLYEQAGDKDIKAYVNGIKPAFDVKPYLKNDRTLVPVRAISEALGAHVNWNQDTQTVTLIKGDHTIILVVNSKQASVDGQPVTLDVPAEVTSDRTFVPIRFITQAFGGKVDWYQTGNIITISTDSPASGAPTSGTSTSGSASVSGAAGK